MVCRNHILESRFFPKRVWNQRICYAHFPTRLLTCYVKKLINIKQRIAFVYPVPSLKHWSPFGPFLSPLLNVEGESRSPTSDKGADLIELHLRYIIKLQNAFLQVYFPQSCPSKQVVITWFKVSSSSRHYLHSVSDQWRIREVNMNSISTVVSFRFFYFYLQ